jgi:uncharacterized protein YjaG (DUF416 family)
VTSIEDRIKQDKLLSGFPPFVEIAIEIKQLPLDRQIIFFCACGERMLPVYMLVNGRSGWRDISNLRSVLDDLWRIAGGLDLQEIELELLEGKAGTIFLESYYEDDPDDYDGYWGVHEPTIYLDIAIGISDFLKLVLQYIKDRNVDTYKKIFTKIIYTIYEYLDLHLGNIDSLWDLQRSREEQDSIAMNSILMQTELQKQRADVELLRSLPELTPETISAFRANSCVNGLSILGSLDEVRANLD